MNMFLEQCPEAISLIENVCCGPEINTLLWNCLSWKWASNRSPWGGWDKITILSYQCGRISEVLRIITYMAPFVNHISDLIAHLRELLKKDSAYKWATSYQFSQEQIRETEMLFTYFEPLQTSVIQVDAVSKDLGAAFTQESKPIAFTSKSFTEKEYLYANIEWEQLAVDARNSEYTYMASHLSLRVIIDPWMLYNFNWNLFWFINTFR